MEKEKERSEVKVKEGPPGFTFLKGEKYIFKYSFRAKEGMKVPCSAAQISAFGTGSPHCIGQRCTLSFP